jgi:hypothetical protein
MGDLQDPKMEVRSYHIPGHIFWGSFLKFRPKIWNRYLQCLSVPDMPLMICGSDVDFGAAPGEAKELGECERPSLRTVCVPGLFRHAGCCKIHDFVWKNEKC